MSKPGKREVANAIRRINEKLDYANNVMTEEGSNERNAWMIYDAPNARSYIDVIKRSENDLPERITRNANLLKIVGWL